LFCSCLANERFSISLGEGQWQSSPPDELKFIAINPTHSQECCF
jgi:hypothetical protein